MANSQTVRIYCAGKPATASVAGELVGADRGQVYRCDACGHLVRRVVVEQRIARKKERRP